MNIDTFRRRLLRVHGWVLTVVALALAVFTTYSRITGQGPLGFLQQNPLAWVGLFQAYLLITIIAVLLIQGSREQNPQNLRKWNIVGALAHVPPLVAALSSLDVFNSMGVLGVVWIPIAFHAAFICLEGTAAVWPRGQNRER